MLALAAGLAVLGWRSPGSGRWDTLDTAIIATGAFLLAWVFYIDPMLAGSASNFATAVAIAVPAGALDSKTRGLASPRPTIGRFLISLITRSHSPSFAARPCS